VTLVDVHEVFVDPAVGLRSGLVECLLVRAAADVAHRADPAALGAWSALAERGRQPVAPHVRRLDDVVVDAHDPGELEI
jgi:hypothetical protein